MYLINLLMLNTICATPGYQSRRNHANQWMFQNKLTKSNDCIDITPLHPLLSKIQMLECETFNLQELEAMAGDFRSLVRLNSLQEVHYERMIKDLFSSYEKQKSSFKKLSYSKAKLETEVKHMIKMFFKTLFRIIKSNKNADIASASNLREYYCYYQPTAENE